jgi:hypothetical protein
MLKEKFLRVASLPSDSRTVPVSDHKLGEREELERLRLLEGF